MQIAVCFLFWIKLRWPKNKICFRFFFPRRVTERPERHLRKWFYSHKLGSLKQYCSFRFSLEVILKQKWESLRWSQGLPGLGTSLRTIPGDEEKRKTYFADQNERGLFGAQLPPSSAIGNIYVEGMYKTF